MLQEQLNREDGDRNNNIRPKATSPDGSAEYLSLYSTCSIDYI